MSDIISITDSTPTEYLKYILADVNDSDRLAVQHGCFKPSFMQTLQHLLTHYGLGGRLQAGLAQAQKISILDVGCGEGLQLHDVAALLETRGELGAATLYGIDNNVQAIATAEGFSKVSQPPRPYLNFYVHDVMQPLEDCLGLRMDMDGTPTFDLIYVSLLLEHLPGASQLIAKFYSYLKPGGLLYIRDTVILGGAEFNEVVHPALIPFNQAIKDHAARLNNGQDVALGTANWLHSLGPQQIEALPIKIPIGGTSEVGKMMLRNTILALRVGLPLFVKFGLMSTEQGEQMMATMFRELGPHLEGYLTLIDTIAQKPL
jgi:SAM-dependent methyltransferase